MLLSCSLIGLFIGPGFGWAIVVVVDYNRSIDDTFEHGTGTGLLLADAKTLKTIGSQVLTESAAKTFLFSVRAGDAVALAKFSPCAQDETLTLKLLELPNKIVRMMSKPSAPESRTVAKFSLPSEVYYTVFSSRQAVGIENWNHVVISWKNTYVSVTYLLSSYSSTVDIRIISLCRF